MRNITPGILAFLLLGLLLFTTGCPLLQHSDSTYTPAAFSDGKGGAISVYEEDAGGNLRHLYAQRIDSVGKSLWGEKGVLLANGYKTSGGFSDCAIVTDGAGGAIIAWQACPDEKLTGYISYISRIDLQGYVLWQREARSFYAMISDGVGGAIIASPYASEESEVLVTKIDSRGDFTWGENKVVIARGQYQGSLRMATDGAGGAVVVWEETIFTSNSTPTQVILAQRINAAGGLAWGETPVALMAAANVYIEGAAATEGESGGVIIAWNRWPQGKIEGDSPESVLMDVCVQKLDKNGAALWATEGIPLGIVETAGIIASPVNPLLINDSSGGAVIMWEDMRNGLVSIYAQRVDAAGAVKWQPGGVKVCYVNSNSSFLFRRIISDGQGGMIVSCKFTDAGTGNTGILVQKLDAAGKTVWPGNGIVVTGSDIICYNMSSDGQGGALVSWSAGALEKGYIQRVDANGILLWGLEGIRLDS
jgi:hypothetical protein